LSHSSLFRFARAGNSADFWPADTYYNEVSSFLQGFLPTFNEFSVKGATEASRVFGHNKLTFETLIL